MAAEDHRCTCRQVRLLFSAKCQDYMNPSLTRFLLDDKRMAARQRNVLGEQVLDGERNVPG